VILFAAKEGITMDANPKIVLVEHNPWAMVVGSDSPSFALYDNGTVIFRNKKGELLSAKMGPDEIKKLTPDEAFFKLENRYDATRWTDQPMNTVWTWQNGQKKGVTVYGDLREDKEARAGAPKEFLALYDRLIAYNNPGGSKWMSEKIEVMVWPFEYSKDTPIPWPKGWPDLNDPAARHGADLHAIPLDSKHYNDLINLIKKMKPTQAILMGGKKWAISFRIPFPKEALWMKN